jgi:hypothetical protein
MIMNRTLLYSTTFLFTTIIALTVYLAWEREMYRSQYRAMGQSKGHAATLVKKPSPELSAGEVVEIQLDALQHNDRYDNGIQKAYYFTTTFSEHGRKSFEDFQKLIRSDRYASMLNHHYVSSSSVEYYQNKAFQVVTVVDFRNRKTEFLFELELQKSGPSRGCWLTKNVRIIREESSFSVI